MTILAVFRSRAQSLDYAERLARYGVDATTMPTPKEAKIGCGLCVRFQPRDYMRAKAIIKYINEIADLVNNVNAGAGLMDGTDGYNIAEGFTNKIFIPYAAYTGE